MVTNFREIVRDILRDIFRLVEIASVVGMVGLLLFIARHFILKYW